MSFCVLHKLACLGRRGSAACREMPHKICIFGRARAANPLSMALSSIGKRRRPIGATAWQYPWRRILCDFLGFTRIDFVNSGDELSTRSPHQITRSFDNAFPPVEAPLQSCGILRYRSNSPATGSAIAWPTPPTARRLETDGHRGWPRMTGRNVLFPC